MADKEAEFEAELAKARAQADERERAMQRQIDTLESDLKDAKGTASRAENALRRYRVDSTSVAEDLQLERDELVSFVVALRLFVFLLDFSSRNDVKCCKNVCALR